MLQQRQLLFPSTLASRTRSACSLLFVFVLWAQLLTLQCDLLLTLLHNPGFTHGTLPPLCPTLAAAYYLWLLLSCMRRSPAGECLLQKVTHLQPHMAT
jgi:hypothetical protein